MDAQTVETHVSILFFVGDRVFKLKKPVQFDFVDLSTRAAREAMCHREVELNRRLAPDVYEGVAEVIGPDGEPWDHLVVMRRMPVDRRLSSLVALGDPRTEPALRAVAGQLARFHATGDRGPHIDAAATRDALEGLWRANTLQLHGRAGHLVSRSEVDLLHALATAYLDGRSALFDDRIAGGHVVDGHGDLLADDIYVLDDGPRLLDCLEFDDRLRYGDVASDVAFLAMDLERLGAPDLATSFIEAYEDPAGTPIPRSLLDLSIAYRAQVRLLVTCLRAAQIDDPSDAGTARSLFQLCLHHLERATVRLVLVGGAPGSGKTTIAHGLSERFGWPVERSDVVRKELAGLTMTQGAPVPMGSGIYDAAHTARTYDELLARATRHLSMGRSVVLDASWTSARFRNEARAAARATGARLVELSCVLPMDVAAARAEQRRLSGHDASDAGDVIARALAAETEPWPEAEPISTLDAPAEAIDRAIAIAEEAGVRVPSALAVDGRDD